MHWISEVYRRWLDFRGRSRRMEYWSFVVLLVVVQLGLSVLVSGAGGARSDSGKTMLGGVVMAVFLIVFFVPGLAVTVRRLHDSDRSGWWAALPVVPSVLYGVTAETGGLIALLLWVGGGVVTWLALVVLLLLDGTRGPNRYGPDPKASVSPG